MSHVFQTIAECSSIWKMSELQHAILSSKVNVAVACFFPSLFLYCFFVFFAVIPSLALRLFVASGVEVSRSLVPSTCRWAKHATDGHNGPHDVCRPCPNARLGHGAAECHRQRDWAVSIGSHTQDIDLSKAPPHPRAPIRLVDTVRVLKTRSTNMAINSPCDTVVICAVATRVFHPAGRHLQGKGWSPTDQRPQQGNSRKIQFEARPNGQSN